MADKVSINQCLKVIKSKTHHKLIDVFNAIVLISSQIKRDFVLESIFELESKSSDIFLIRTDKTSLSFLAKIIIRKFPYMHRSTVIECIKELINMNILLYNPIYLGWQILDLEESFISSSKSGYMSLRSLFFSEYFYNLPISAKKIIFYFCILMSTKGFNKAKTFIVNLKNENNPIFDFLNTQNQYYIKTIIENFLLEEGFTKKIEHKFYQHRNIQIKNKFLFLLKPSKKLEIKLTSKEAYNLCIKHLLSSSSTLYNYLNEIRKKVDQSIKNRITDILIQEIISSISYYSTKLQLEVIDKIFIKLHHEEINHPKAYINELLKQQNRFLKIS